MLRNILLFSMLTRLYNRSTKCYRISKSKICFLNDFELLYGQSCGWLRQKICINHEEKEYQLLRNLLTRSFTLLEENRKNLGYIRAESFFSDNYMVELPEDFPFSLMLFLSCLGLCDSERPMMPVYDNNWYYH